MSETTEPYEVPGRKVNDGGPAYPKDAVYTDEDGWVNGADGMSLRAWLAGTIAAGCRAGKHIWSSGEVARCAVRDADAIIAELEKA